MSTPDRVCATCGRPLPGSNAKYCSLACYHAAMPTLHHRAICANCGVGFSGHIRSTLCPVCREAHNRLRARANRYRTRHDLTRKIGSTDHCANCGAEYTVSNGAQRYCPACAPDAILNRIRTRNRIAQQQYRQQHQSPAQGNNRKEE